MTEKETANHQVHPGNLTRAECADAIEHYSSDTGSAMKCIWRKDFDPIEDLKRIILYVEQKIGIGER
jgi:hypothetical protein